ncbi:MAG: DUF6449 domain-containing protein [Peptococcaceae bacterium]
MTSNSLSTKKQKNSGALLLHSLRSYWWLAVICSVVYGFAGPIFTLLKLDSITRPSQSNYLASATEEGLLETHLGQMARWLHVEGFMMLYLSAVVLAAIIGCVMFFYLQQKKQVNFYHSQPITRTRLFINQYVAGLLVNVVPLLLMVVLMSVLVAGYHLGEALDLAAILQHVGYMLLLLWASYSIAVFSGQLAGTMLTQMALNAVLHFAVPVAAVLLNLMCNLFLATYGGTPDLITASLKFSPLCATFAYLSDAVVPTALKMTAPAMAGNMLLAQLGTGLLLSALAWVLYQKRPSEATGKALVYSISEPVVKAYLMFVVSIAAGMLFMTVGNKLFFYFAVISFAVLTHMTCEVIIQHDFRAMGKRLPQCAIILLLILAVVGVFRFDLLGYDSYLPAPDKVEQVSFSVPSVDDISGYSYKEISYSPDIAVKQAVHDLLQPVVAEQHYRGSQFDYYDSVYADGESTTTLQVGYKLNNGRTVTRQYRMVPRSTIEENYEKLYGLQTYRDVLYGDILQLTPDTLQGLAVNGMDLLSTDDRDWLKENPNNNSEILRRYENACNILQAYQQDLRDRQFTTLTGGAYCTLEIQMPMPERTGAYWWYNLTVFREDRRTAALLEKLQLVESSREYNFDEALIFRCQAMTESEMRQQIGDLLWGEELPNEKAEQVIVESTEVQTGLQRKTNQQIIEQYAAKLEGKAQLVGRISGTEAVSAFIRQTGLLYSGNLFSNFDDRHFVLLHRSEASEDDWSLQLLYAGTLPEQYL